MTRTEQQWQDRERYLLARNTAEVERRRTVDEENSQLVAELYLVRKECIRQRERAEVLAVFIDGLMDIEIPATEAKAMEATFPEVAC